MNHNILKQQPRKGCKDIWNSFMVEGTLFSNNDIPYCPTTATVIPKKIITYDDAHALYNKEIRNKNYNFYNEAYICWYIDDYKFDNTKGIWNQPYKAKQILDHFGGIITPDFSCCHDFPHPIKMYNTYRMRAFGYWYGSVCNGNVINNVRWGTPETYSYCFDGIPHNSIIAIGTVASSLTSFYDRIIFENGLSELVNRLNPHTILVYGSSKYNCFDKLIQEGITIITFPSKTSLAFNGGVCNE